MKRSTDLSYYKQSVELNVIYFSSSQRRTKKVHLPVISLIISGNMYGFYGGLFFGGRRRGKASKPKKKKKEHWFGKHSFSIKCIMSYHVLMLVEAIQMCMWPIAMLNL